MQPLSRSEGHLEALNSGRLRRPLQVPPGLTLLGLHRCGAQCVVTFQCLKVGKFRKRFRGSKAQTSLRCSGAVISGRLRQPLRVPWWLTLLGFHRQRVHLERFGGHSLGPQRKTLLGSHTGAQTVRSLRQVPAEAARPQRRRLDGTGWIWIVADSRSTSHTLSTRQRSLRVPCPPRSKPKMSDPLFSQRQVRFTPDLNKSKTIQDHLSL